MKSQKNARNIQKKKRTKNSLESLFTEMFLNEMNIKVELNKINKNQPDFNMFVILI